MRKRYRTKDPRVTQHRWFRCTVCGTEMDMPKRFGRTYEGHVKTAYCYRCKDIVDWVQTED